MKKLVFAAFFSMVFMGVSTSSFAQLKVDFENAALCAGGVAMGAGTLLEVGAPLGPIGAAVGVVSGAIIGGAITPACSEVFNGSGGSSSGVGAAGPSGGGGAGGAGSGGGSAGSGGGGATDRNGFATRIQHRKN